MQGSVWNLDENHPDRVYRPSRGLFRLTKYRATDTDQLKEELVPKQPKKIKEQDFYESIVKAFLSASVKAHSGTFSPTFIFSCP